jgi:hypothetical protein
MFRGGEREVRVQRLTSVTIAHKMQLLSITLSHLPCISTNMHTHKHIQTPLNAPTYQCPCLPIPVLTNTRTYQYPCLPIPVLTNTRTYQYPCLPMPVLTNTRAYQYPYLPIPVLTNTRAYQCLCPCFAGEIDSGDDEDDIEVVAEEVLVENDSVRFLKAMRIETAKGTYVRAVGKRRGGDRIKLIKCSIQSLSIYL